jgi:peroxiredoxin
MNKLGYMFLAIGAAAAAIGCTSRHGWSIDGNVEGGEGQRLAIEGFNNGSWYVVDSVDIDNNGKFLYESEAPAAYPEIMRISLNGEAIYFPIDSIDAITVTTSAKAFTEGYSLSGNKSAERVQAVDNMIAEAIKRNHGTSLQADTALKRKLIQEITSDSTAIVAYYIINKSVDGKALFDPTDRFDNRIYGAVAQLFATLRPNDPRTAYLSSIFLKGKATINPSIIPTKEIEASVKGLIDIELYDNKGTKHKLSEVAGKGNVTVLSFTQYGIEASPAYNVILNKVYQRYHGQGLEIYQVSFDEDEVAWKQTAVNLPWITVWNSSTDGAQTLINYNVGALPLTYVIDRNGDIAARIENPNNIESQVARFF